jgi:ABC-type Zn uptake system ZnuABC Zn-binding protein ZnuA
MKSILNISVFLLVISFSLLAQEKIKVVTTMTTYANVTEYIGGDLVEVKAIIAGNQDPHFVRPRPSYAVWLNEADLFVETGLDLELWVPPLIDKSANPDIRSGQKGYVAVADGVRLLEIPAVADRSQGDLHIYGNPHIYTSPINIKTVAENIAIGLSKVSPENESYFRERLADFKTQIDIRMYGEELVDILTAKVLDQLTLTNKLIDFLNSKSFKDKQLIDYLGGWMKDMLPVRGGKYVAYHNNWVYFENLFGLIHICYVEPKPGIPPSPKHVQRIIADMKDQNVQLIIAANYFDESKVGEIAEKVGATALITPMAVNGVPEVDNFFKLVDYWVSGVKGAFAVTSVEKIP